MRKKLALATLLLMIVTVSVANASVRATPNQELALRTGPNTAYVWLYMMPQSTSIRAIEYEEGNDVTWVLVEYSRDGQLCRGYTGLKRMTVHGNIPWADHYNEVCWINGNGTVYAAPSSRAGYRGYLSGGDCVTLLDYEGDYAYIEFYDGDTPSRGYVPASMLEGEPGASIKKTDEEIRMVPAVPNQELAFRTCPDANSVWLYMMPQSTSLMAIEYEEGNGVTWVQVEFMKAGKVVRAYTGLKRMSVMGSIPWANHLNESGWMLGDCDVLAAPDSRGAYRGTVYEDEYVTLLRYEGEYAYIEFYDGDTLSRGYVPAWLLD